MKNEIILMPILNELNNAIEVNETKELIDVNIKNLNPKQYILKFPGRISPINYIKQESKWYNSQDLNINGWMDHIEIWKQISSLSGMINSNYGWCVYSEKNYNQYQHVVTELIKNKSSRRGTIFYNRPKMWKDWNRYNMQDFMCTINTQHFIRDNKLIYIVNQRSCDIIYGFFNDFAWHCEVYIKMYKELKKSYPELKIGKINYNISSLHIYKRHYKMLKEMVSK